MKTVLQDLIEGFNVTPDETFCEWLREQQNNLLEKEKEQIIEAYCDGFVQGSEGDRIMSEEYYNQNYNKEVL